MLKTNAEETEESKSKLSIADLDFKKQSGLLPVIAQDESSGAVLMLTYANLEAVKKTQASGLAHYWSRSCKALWKKGRNSVNLQHIVDVLVDCDGRHTVLLSKAKWCSMSHWCTYLFFPEITNSDKRQIK